MSDPVAAAVTKPATAGMRAMPGLRGWLAVIAVLAVLPHAPGLDSDFGRSLLSQMGIAVVFALSYNVLFGQTGLLSFGHAVYFGLGGYVAIHVMRAINHGLPLPMPLVPLAGAAGGLLFGLVFGALTTRRAGTIFALISLGVGELVYAATFMLPGYFGGEEGVTASRTKGLALIGLDLGPQLAVYYLIALWALIAAALMQAFARTPVGRMCFAVRDNPERAEFVGYNTHGVRFFAFAVGALFAGMAGGLHALNYEIVSADAVSAQRSGTVLLMAYIGGAGHFTGPILGAVTLTWLQTSLSGYTSAWLLYLGLFFVLTILFAPSGLVGLILMHGPIVRTHGFRGVLRAYAIALVPAMVMACGAVLLIEMSYRLSTQSELGSRMRLFGLTVDAATAWPWLAGVLLMAGGFLVFRSTWRLVRLAWDRAAEEARAPRDDGIVMSAEGSPQGTRPPGGASRSDVRGDPSAAGPPQGTRPPGGASRSDVRGDPTNTTPIALQLRDVHKSFGATAIIRGVSLDVHERERHAIIGPNGAGKSTLFNLVSGRIAPTAGTMQLHGARIEGMTPFEIHRRGLTRSFQVTNIFPRLTVFENIRCSLLWPMGYKYNFWRRTDALADATARTEATLERIGMTRRRNALAGVLTYAEQRALEIGITIAGDADVILLDEPTAGMSRSEADHAVALIRTVSQDRTLVIVEHDMSVVFDLADRISVLVYGKVIATDTPERVRANEAVQAAYLGTAEHA